jgi:hypothetical protein
MHAATTTTSKTQIKTKGKMVKFYFNGEKKMKEIPRTVQRSDPFTKHKKN